MSESGDDVMETAVRRTKELRDADRMAESLGIELVEVGPESATVTMDVAPQMVNGYGICHGGILFLLADAAFSYACNTTESVQVASEAQVIFLRSAQVGDALVAVAAKRTQVGRGAVYDATVRRGDEVVAEFRGQCRVLSGRPPATGTTSV